MDASAIQEVINARGPFASVYADISHDTEDAAKLLDLRWRELREELRGQGAPESVLGPLEKAFFENPPVVGKGGHALIAEPDQVLLNRSLPEPPAMPMARHSRLPYLLPLAAQDVPRVPYVVIAVDRAGAELRGYEFLGSPVTELTVEGSPEPLHKVGNGGWSHRKLQQRVEDTSKHNATVVADAAARLVRRLRAGLLVVAGEVQARTALRDALPADCQRIAVDSSGGGRAEGIDVAAFEAEVRELVWQRQRARHEQLATALVAELNRDGGKAVQGLAPVVAVLRQANVQTMAISQVRLRDRKLWLGSEPTAIAMDETELVELGIEPKLARADEVLPWAAVATGADLLLTPEVELPGGVAVLLRHP